MRPRPPSGEIIREGARPMKQVAVKTEDPWIKELEEKSADSKHHSEGDLKSVAPWVSYDVNYIRDSVCLDGDFTINKLESLITHMKKYAK